MMAVDTGHTYMNMQTKNNQEPHPGLVQIPSLSGDVNEDQEGYVLPMNYQPATSSCDTETEGQGYYENRGVNEDQEGYVPMNREVMTLTQGGAMYDNIPDYENSPFNKNDKKNDNEGLQITRDEHPYADI